MRNFNYVISRFAINWQEELKKHTSYSSYGNLGLYMFETIIRNSVIDDIENGKF